MNARIIVGSPKKKGGPIMSRITVAILYVLCCISGCATPVPSPDEQAPPPEILRSDSPKDVYRPCDIPANGTNHKYTEEFLDPEETVSKGPITKVQVAHAGYIHGIRLYYGWDGQGIFHLGPPENEFKRWGIRATEWEVPEGERIVRIEGEIAGYYISRLRFFTDKGNASPQFGGRSGERFDVNDIGGLRTISGYVNKTRHPDYNRAITSMTFHFGAPCRIKDIKYDLAALDDAILKATPTVLTRQEIPNRTSVEQTVAYKYKKGLTTQKTLRFMCAVGLKLGSEVSVNLPFKLGGVKTSFELSTSTEFSETYVNKSTQDMSWEVPVRIPPGKKVIAVSTYKRCEATVPFTYTVAWYWGTPDNIFKEVTLPGVYEGVHVEELKHDFKEVSLE